MRDQCADEIFGLGRRKLFIEMDNQQVADAEVANERDLVLCRGQQMRGALWSQNLFGMRIKSDHDRCAICRARMIGRSGNNLLMTAMDAVENADCEEKRT